MTDETRGSKREPPGLADATTDSADSTANITAAMTAVLKAMKPLDALGQSYNEAAARRDVFWNAYTPLRELPKTTDRALIERAVQKAETAYLAWREANELLDAALFALATGEQELRTAWTALKEATEAGGANKASADDKTFAAATYMLTLLGRYSWRTKSAKRTVTAPEPLDERDEIPLAKFRAAVVDFLLNEAVVRHLHETLEPLVQEIALGARLENIKLPVRPLEEEIVRYLSNLENTLQSRMELKRKTVPLLKQRLTVVANFSQVDEALATALEEITSLERAKLQPYIDALKDIRSEATPRSGRYFLTESYQYEKTWVKDPDELDHFDRATVTSVEKDQIAYLRKQMRAVAFLIAHREEATYTLNAFDGDEVKVYPRGVAQSGNWQESLAWYAELQKKRDAAELETLSRATKVELLNRNIEHYKEKVNEELAALYKTLCAIIPRGGPKPANELRKLMNQASWMCKPLQGTDAAYPIY